MKKPWGLPEWERQAIVDAYVAGEKVDAIGAEFGVDRAYPRVLARRRGIPARQPQKSDRKGEHSTEAVLATVNEVR